MPRVPPVTKATRPMSSSADICFESQNPRPPPRRATVLSNPGEGVFPGSPQWPIPALLVRPPNRTGRLSATLPFVKATGHVPPTASDVSSVRSTTFDRRWGHSGSLTAILVRGGAWPGSRIAGGPPDAPAVHDMSRCGWRRPRGGRPLTLPPRGSLPLPRAEEGLGEGYG